MLAGGPGEPGEPRSVGFSWAPDSSTVKKTVESCERPAAVSAHKRAGMSLFTVLHNKIFLLNFNYRTQKRDDFCWKGKWGSLWGT